MIVIDASAVLELLLGTRAGHVVMERTLDRGETLHAPQLLDLEVVQVLRRYARESELSVVRAKQALEDLATVERIPTVSLEVVIPYPRLGEVKRLVHPPEVEILEEQYSDETVRLTLKVVDGRMEWLEEVFASLGAEITPAGG